MLFRSLTSFALEKGLLDATFASPKSSHNTSEIKYSDDIKKFLYQFKSLFPLIVLNTQVRKIAPLLMRLPSPFLKLIDSAYRLFGNKRFYPPARFTVGDRLRGLRRYLAIVSK